MAASHRIMIPARGHEDWRARLADPALHWREGFSAMAAAQSWLAGFPPEIAALCGPAAELQLAVAEHNVPMPGRGKASQCDIFALVHAGGRDMAVAVEAKVAEPFGDTVADWLGRTPSENRLFRLNGVAEILGLPDPPRALRYQLLHRTASAVVEARRFRRPVAAMLVQSFSPAHMWFEDFAAFTQLFGIAAAPGSAGECLLRCGLTLRLGWAVGDPRYLRHLGA